MGPTGKAYGLDMTDEMLALARENQRKAGVANVEFLRGEIEAIPLPDDSVDVIISNCVINLSADKDQVFAEAFRVLRPGGRLAVSDVVVRGEVPAQIRKNIELWIGCVAGALEEGEYRAKLARPASSRDLEPTRIYRGEDARDFLPSRGATGLSADGGRRQVHECVRPGAQAAAGVSETTERPDLARRLRRRGGGHGLPARDRVGSGIMGERLAAGNVAVALLANTLATGAGLVALILTFGPISGAHFNPAVTLADASQGGPAVGRRAGLCAVQIAGAFAGVAAAHAMFELPLFFASRHARQGPRRCSASSSRRSASWR